MNSNSIARSVDCSVRLSCARAERLNAATFSVEQITKPDIRNLPEIRGENLPFGAFTHIKMIGLAIKEYLKGSPK